MIIKIQFCFSRRAFCILQIILFSSFGLYSVQAEVSQEYKVKAAFLYNLAKMVEWPEENGLLVSSGVFAMCFFGEESFGDELDSLQGKSIQDRLIELKRGVPLESITQCHVLFISIEEQNNLADILPVLNGLPVLTVGESEYFAENGGIVNLPQVGGRIRIEINLKMAQNVGLKMSSKLLTLAKIIE
jgi:hypothetical protein